MADLPCQSEISLQERAITKIELSFQFGRYKSLELGHVRIFSAQIGVEEFNFIMIDSIQSIGCHMIVFKKSILLSLRNVYNITYMLVFNFMPQKFNLVQVNVVMLCLFILKGFSVGKRRSFWPA